jgi:RNA recognition motif-containing protein
LGYKSFDGRSKIFGREQIRTSRQFAVVSATAREFLLGPFLVTAPLRRLLDHNPQSRFLRSRWLAFPLKLLLGRRDRPKASFVVGILHMTKMYVGNLPFSMDESAVRALFEKHGAVQSVALINDRDTGRPRGFGFVEMASADAARAMQALNGHDVDGRALKVNEAQERTGGGGGGGGGSRGPKRW